MRHQCSEYIIWQVKSYTMCQIFRDWLAALLSPSPAWWLHAVFSSTAARLADVIMQVDVCRHFQRDGWMSTSSLINYSRVTTKQRRDGWGRAPALHLLHFQQWTQRRRNRVRDGGESLGAGGNACSDAISTFDNHRLKFSGRNVESGERAEKRISRISLWKSNIHHRPQRERPKEAENRRAVMADSGEQCHCSVLVAWLGNKKNSRGKRWRWAGEQRQRGGVKGVDRKWSGDDSSSGAGVRGWGGGGLYLRTGSVLKWVEGLLSPCPLPLMANILTS